MKRAGSGWFSATGRFAGDLSAAMRTDSGPPVGVRRRFLLELQWRGRGGRFRHIAVRPPGLRQVAGALGVIAFLVVALGVAGTFSAATDPPRAHSGVGALLNEQTALKARHDDLRERAFDLAEQLYARVEQGRRMVRLADTTGHGWEGPCPRPPARGAGDEAILAWLDEEGAHLEAIGNAATAGRVEPGVMQASVPVPATRAPVTGAPVSRAPAPVRDAAAPQVADIGSATRHTSPPAMP